MICEDLGYMILYSRSGHSKTLTHEETEFLIKLIKGEYRIMCHLHKEDDALFLMSLVDQFGIKFSMNIF